MTSIKILRMACVLLASMAVFNCSDSGGGKEEKDEIGKTDDGHEVRIFQEGSLDNILIRIDTTAITDSSFNGTAVFKNMNPDDIPNVGDIISSGETKLAEYGFLYKVLGVSTKNGITEVVVRQASLEEAIKNVDFKGEVEYDFDEDGNALAVRQKIYPTDSKSITLPTLSVKEEIVLEAGSENIKVKGSLGVEVKYTAKFIFEMKIKDHKIHTMKMSLVSDSELTLEGKVGGKIEGELLQFPIGKKIKLPKTKFWIGLFPIVIDNELQQELKISGSAELGMTVKYTFKGNSEYGVKYENEKTELIAENNPRNTFELEHYNEGNVRIGILTDFTVKLYGLAGLSFEGGPAFDLSVANTMPIGVFVYDEGFSEANDEVKLAFGIDMKMEPAELKVLGKKLIPSTGTIAWESFIALETKDESPLPKFANPDANEVTTGKINVESTIERTFLNYPVSEFGFCVEKSAGECKSGNGKRDPKTELVALGKVALGEKLSFNSDFEGLEEGTTYRIMPYFKNGVGGTYYDKATLYTLGSSSSSPSSSSSSQRSSSSSQRSSSSSAGGSFYCDYGYEYYPAPNVIEGGGCFEIASASECSQDGKLVNSCLPRDRRTDLEYCDYGPWDEYGGGCWPIKTVSERNKCIEDHNLYPNIRVAAPNCYTY